MLEFETHTFSLKTLTFPVLNILKAFAANSNPHRSESTIKAKQRKIDFCQIERT